MTPKKNPVLEGSVLELDPPSLILKTLDVFEIETIGDLLDADLSAIASARGVGRTKILALGELIDRASELVDPENAAARADLLDELDAVGVDLESRWSDVLVHLDTRSRNMLERSEITTMRELALRVQAATLIDVDGFGVASQARVEAQLDVLIVRGPQGYLWGERGYPASLEDAVERYLGELDNELDLAMIQARYFGAQTLEQIGEQHELSRERVRQRIDRIVQRGRLRWSEPLGRYLGALEQRLRARGGLLPPAAIDAFVRRDQHRYVVMGFELLGVWSRWCPQTDYLTTLSIGAMEGVLSELRAGLEELPGERIEPEQARAAASVVGWIAPAEEIVPLLRARWGVIERSDGSLSHPWFDLTNLSARVLAEAGRALKLDELTQLCVAALGDAHRPSERQVYLALARSMDVYYVDRGLYLHASNLPISRDELGELASACIELLQEKEHAVSATSLLEELSALRPVDDGVTPMMLRDAMGRDDRVKLFQSTDMVAHLSAFSGQRKTHQDHVEEILSRATTVMSCDEVCDAMPAHVSFHRAAIYAVLQQASFALNVGQGRFVHRDSIGLQEGALSRLLDEAIEWLEGGARIVTSARLLENLSSPAAAFLGAMERGDGILFALLSEDDRCVAGAGSVLMSSTRSGEPLVAAIVMIASELVLCSPSEIHAELGSRCGWSASSGSLYYALEKAEKSGAIRKVFKNLRCVAELAGAELRDALTSRFGDLEALTKSSEQLSDADRALLDDLFDVS